MNVSEAADQLRALGATIVWGDGEPRIRVPSGALTDDLRAAIREHKPAILVELDFEGSLQSMQEAMIAKLDAGDHEGGGAIREQMTRLILERSCVRCPGVGLAPGDPMYCRECRAEVAGPRIAAEEPPYNVLGDRVICPTCGRMVEVDLFPNEDGELSCRQCASELAAGSPAPSPHGPGRPCGACRSNAWRRGKGVWVCDVCNPDPERLYREWKRGKEGAAA